MNRRWLTTALLVVLAFCLAVSVIRAPRNTVVASFDWHSRGGGPLLVAAVSAQTGAAVVAVTEQRIDLLDTKGKLVKSVLLPKVHLQHAQILRRDAGGAVGLFCIGMIGKAVWAAKYLIVDGRCPQQWSLTLRGFSRPQFLAAGDLDGDGLAEFAVAGGSQVYCLNSGGSVRWMHRLPHSAGASAAAWTGITIVPYRPGRVVAATRDGKLQGWDMDGGVVFAGAMRGGVTTIGAGSLLYGGPAAIVAAGNDAVGFVEQNSGSPVHVHHSIRDARSLWFPAFSGVRGLVAQAGDRGLVLLGANGRQHGRLRMGSPITAVTVATGMDGRSEWLLVGTQARRVWILDHRLRMVGSVKTDGAVTSLDGGGNLLVAGTNRGVAAWTLATHHRQPWGKIVLLAVVLGCLLIEWRRAAATR